MLDLETEVPELSERIVPAVAGKVGLRIDHLPAQRRRLERARNALFDRRFAFLDNDRVGSVNELCLTIAGVPVGARWEPAQQLGISFGQADADRRGAAPLLERQAVAAFGSDGFVDGALGSSAQFAQGGVLDRLFARRKDELQRGRVNDIDPDIICAAAADLADRRQFARDCQSMEVERRIEIPERALEDTDPAAVPRRNVYGLGQPVLPWAIGAVERDRQGIMKGCRSGEPIEMVVPVGRDLDVDCGANRAVGLVERDGLRTVPGIRRYLGRPCQRMRRVPRGDRHAVPCKAEHTHARRILAGGNVVAPVRSPERQDALRVGDPLSVIADREDNPIATRERDFDAGRRCAAGVLQKLIEHVVECVVEQSADAVDRVGADARAD